MNKLIAFLLAVAFVVVVGGLLTTSLQAKTELARIASAAYPDSKVFTICKYDVQYIVVTPTGSTSGVAITVAYDHDGRPAKCKD